MGQEQLLKYIGFRNYGGDPSNFDYIAKKFSASQFRLILEAFREKYNVRVIGAYRRDAVFLAEKEGRNIVTDSMADHFRDIAFNKFRPVLFKTQLAGSTQGPPELWMLVFPSRQYVEQYAELLFAILVELELPEDLRQLIFNPLTVANGDEEKEQSIAAIETQIRNRVTVTHFPKLSGNIGRWTNLQPFAAEHIRFGDIVCIGNVDVFEDGLRDLGFLSESAQWSAGGLDNIFLIRVMVNRSNRARLVLLGVKECFWGEASAQYAEALLEAGARHILYGSKAATLVEYDFTRKVVAPTTFVTIERGLGSNGQFLPEKDVLTDEVTSQNILKSMAAAFEIVYSGLGVTVPTVMGEDYDEYDTYKMLRPTCMDCENGHIAKVTKTYNQRDERHPVALHANIARDARFVPMHFVTDYIYARGEPRRPDDANLATDSRDETHITHKLRGYRKIGQYFGSYANVFGLRQDFDLPHLIDDMDYNESHFLKFLTDARNLTSVGASRDAIAVLLSTARGQSISLQAAMALATVCQKNGFVGPAFRCLSLLDEAAKENASVPLIAATRCNVVRMKLLMQVGRFFDAETLANGPLKCVEALKGSGQYGPVYRRQAIVLAIRGDAKGSQEAIEKAHAAGSGDLEAAKCKLFQALSAYSTGQYVTTGELSNIRKDFFAARSGEEPWMKLGLIKAAVATLLLETGIELARANSRHNLRARKLLATVHVLSRRLGAGECAETFGEIVHLTSDSRLRDLMKLALRQDDAGRRIFAEWSAHAGMDISGLAEKSMRVLYDVKGKKTESHLVDMIETAHCK